MGCPDDTVLVDVRLESRLLRGPFQCEGERDHLGSLLFRQLSLDLDLCLQKSLI